MAATGRTPLARAAALAATAAVLVLGAAPALADLTPLGWELGIAPYGGEPNLAPVLDGLYGPGNWERVSDYGTDTTDQLWAWSAGGSGEAIAHAKYAAYSHDFGLLIGSSGASFDALFSSGGWRMGYFDPNAAPQASFAGTPGNVFRFALSVADNSRLWSSLQADNCDGADHLVTVLITGQDTQHPDNVIGNYAICWEDLDFQTECPDMDYQDLVIEVSGVEPFDGKGVVPEPASVVLFGTVFFAAAAYYRQRQGMV